MWRVLLRWAPTALVGLCLVWSLQGNPLTEPLVIRSAEELRVTLDRAVAHAARPESLLPKLDAALAAQDWARVEALAEVAEQRGVPLGAARQGQINEALAPPPFAAAQSCARCAWDITQCRGVGQLAACALPVELSPLGDMNALRRNALADAPDPLEVALAGVGLSAWAVALPSAGTSLSVKAGATTLRLARRVGTASPALLRTLRARIPAPAARLDAAAWRPFTAITSDLGRTGAATGPSDALLLLRHVSTPGEATRMARVAETMGPQTRTTVELLGPSRVLGSTLRLTTRASAALLLIWAGLLNLGLLLAGWIGQRLARALLKAVAVRL